MVSNVTAQRTASNWPSRATQGAWRTRSNRIETDGTAGFDRLAQERHENGEDVVVPQRSFKWNKGSHAEGAQPVSAGNAGRVARSRRIA
jgi:hypothetical protein